MDGMYRPGWVGRSLGWGTALYLVLPLFIILPVSITDQRFLSLPHEGVSLRHYGALFASSAWFASIAQSFWIACASTLLAVSTGTLFAVACWRINSRGTELLRALMLLDRKSVV